MTQVSFALLQTMVRKAFDPETISVTVGKIGNEIDRFAVTVRDEGSKLFHTFHVGLDNTIGDVEACILGAARELGLKEGPDKIGDEIVGEGAHNHD